MNIRYIFFNVRFKAFLEGQMPDKDKPTLLLVTKNLLF